MFDHAEYINRGVECQSCHADVVKGDGSVPQQTCWTCHNQPAQIAQYGETRLIHTEHIAQHKVECSSCHIKIQHNLSAASALGLGIAHSELGSGTCGSCHEQTHGGPAELYRGIGGRGVPDMPSPMSRARVSCIACHQQRLHTTGDAEVVGQTFVALQASCDKCHGTKYAGVLGTWKGIVSTQLTKTEAAYGNAKSRYEAVRKSLDSTRRLEVERFLDDADHNIRLVKLGHGVHNVNYSTALLNVAAENCDRA
jgi:hypothetical protein